MKLMISGCNGHMGRVVEQICAGAADIEIAAGIDLACHLHSHRHHLTNELTCIRLVAIDPPSTQGASYGAEARGADRRREGAVH